MNAEPELSLEDAVAVLVACTDEGEARALVAAIERLEPTPGQWLSHADELVVLAGSDLSRAGALAQRAVHQLDDAGLIPPAVVVAACEAALRRRTRTPARTALGRLAALTRREGSDVDAVVLAASTGLLHPALDVAERALDLVADRSGDVAPGTRERLAALVPRLDPALRARAAAVLEVDVPSVRVTTDTASPSAATPWAPVDVAPRQLVRLLERGPEDLVSWENGLAALVRLAASDRPALEAAVVDVSPAERWGELRWWPIVVTQVLRAVRGARLAPPPRGLRGLFGRLLGEVSASPEWEAITGEPGGPPGFPPHLLRVAEIAQLLVEQPVPALVATPSHTDGSLAADVLLARLEAAAREGWAPWPLDLEQALLRVVVPDPREGRLLVEHAHALRTTAGEALARWLTSGGMPDPAVTVQRVTGSERVRGGGRRAWFEATLVPRRPPQGALELALLRVTPPRSHAGSPLWMVPWTRLGMLPHHPEIVAAWLLPSISAHADLEATDLVGLRSREGTPGPAFHHVLAHLLAGQPPDRPRAVELILRLTEHGHPWGAAVGEVVGELGASGRLRVGRAVGPLREAAAAGAGREVAVLLITALPSLLPARPHGLPDLLALTASLVAAHGVPEHLGAALMGALELGPDEDGRVAQEARRLGDVVRAAWEADS